MDVLFLNGNQIITQLFDYIRSYSNVFIPSGIKVDVNNVTETSEQREPNDVPFIIDFLENTTGYKLSLFIHVRNIFRFKFALRYLFI